MNDRPMMKCGCAAQGTCSRFGGVDYETPIPFCVIHDCIEISEDPPSLEGRKSRCAYYRSRVCVAGKGNYPREADSSTDLPFFEHREKEEFDRHYCGCFGWN